MFENATTGNDPRRKEFQLNPRRRLKAANDPVPPERESGRRDTVRIERGGGTPSYRPTGAPRLFDVGR